MVSIMAALSCGDMDEAAAIASSEGPFASTGAVADLSPASANARSTAMRQGESAGSVVSMVFHAVFASSARPSCISATAR